MEAKLLVTIAVAVMGALNALLLFLLQKKSQKEIENLKSHLSRESVAFESLYKLRFETYMNVWRQVKNATFFVESSKDWGDPLFSLSKEEKRKEGKALWDTLAPTLEAIAYLEPFLDVHTAELVKEFSETAFELGTEWFAPDLTEALGGSKISLENLEELSVEIKESIRANIVLFRDEANMM